MPTIRTRHTWAAIERAGRRAIRQADNAHAVHGRLVSTVWPPRGCDFNDCLAKAAR